MSRYLLTEAGDKLILEDGSGYLLLEDHALSVLGDIRAGIISNLSSLGANGDGYFSSVPEAPCFEIAFPGDGYLYDMSYGRGTDRLSLIVRGIVQVGETTESQKQLDEWLDPSGSTSVKELLESDTTLGGACDDLRVVSMTGHRRLPIETIPNSFFLCAEWTLDILLSPA